MRQENRGRKKKVCESELSKWLASKTDAWVQSQLADKGVRVAEYTVRSWRCEYRQPAVKAALALIDISNGDLTLNDIFPA